MKKWWIVILSAAACLGVAFLLRQPENTVEVETVQLQPQAVEQTVSCTGIIESEDRQGVSVDTACVISEVLVKEGQAVKTGDPLVRIDKEATRKAGIASDSAQALTLAAMGEEILADKDGVVVSVTAEEGQLLEKGAPCVVLAPYSTLQVRIAIKEKDLPILDEGMLVRVTGDGFRKSGYEGVLADISSTAHIIGTGETVVEGVVELAEGQADDSMRLGLTAKAAVVIAAMDGALVVPYEAVREDENGWEYVYVLEGGVARRRTLAVEKELASGVVLADDGLKGVQIIMQPELVSDGMMAQATEEALT